MPLKLFPDVEDPLGSLRWCLASLRRALDSSKSLIGDPIEINLPENAAVDVFDVQPIDLDTEIAGDLLESIEPRCSPEFSTWLLVERERLAGQIDAKIRQETMQAAAVSDYDRAISMAELGARRSPFDERPHILLVKSLAMAGKLDAAQRHIEATERHFLSELGEKPTPALRNAALLASPPPGSRLSSQAVVKSLLENGQAALSGGAADVGVDCLRQAVGEAEKGQDRKLQAKALFELGSALVHAVRGYDDEGAIVLHSAVEIAQRCGAIDVVISGLREIGYAEAFAGRRPAAEEYLHKALKLTNDAESLAGVHGVIGFNLVDWGRVSEGLQHYELSLELARSSDSRRRQVWALGIGALGHLTAGDHKIAEQWLIECIEIVDELRWASFRPWPVALLAETRLQTGVEPESLRLDLEQAFALSCQLRDPCWESLAARVMALTYAATQDYEQAAEWFTEARQRCVRETDIYSALLVRILADQADICLLQNKTSEANSVARELLSLAARVHMDTYIHRAVELIGK